jgi:S1-C subfamily serine protease
VIVDARRGLAATCGQVLRGSTQVEIVLPDGSTRPASRIHAADPRSDLVLIEFDPKGADLVQVDWADSRTLQLGDWVVAVGRSAMGRQVASAGIVSASVDPAEAGSELDPILTDALITAETAGGPLVNLDGQVVGISQARGDLLGGDPRDGFRTAIPEALVRRIAGERVVDGRAPSHGYLGVTLNPGRRLKGVVVASVSAGSPAADAGLAAGDRILSIDGRTVRDAEGLSRAVELAPVGQEMTLVVERQGKKFEAKFKTRPRPHPYGFEPPAAEPTDEPDPEAAPTPPGPDQPKAELPPALPDAPKAETP